MRIMEVEPLAKLPCKGTHFGDIPFSTYQIAGGRGGVPDGRYYPSFISHEIAVVDGLQIQSS